ncbi:MAG: hypothetical protein WC216_02870 [Gallionella sp.]
MNPVLAQTLRQSEHSLAVRVGIMAVTDEDGNFIHGRWRIKWAVRVKFTPDSSLEHNSVIPAKAGIQLIEKIPPGGSRSMFCPLCGVYISLDSRFRGNDDHL